ncbi:MAG: response regulator transcription factor [Epsilonproteobacteria bacterium]|nr:response regulator transcription factor [Campylobacterota bacterium]
MKKKSILIIEDEEEIAYLINNRLDKSLYTVTIAFDGEEAMKLLLKNSYDLVTVDIMLPKVNGLEICRYISNHRAETLMLVVSALNQEDDIVKGYDYGADDYISKPFSPKELALKIQAMFRRSAVQKNPSVVIQKHFTLNEEEFSIALNGFNIKFTPSEYFIVKTLAKYPQKVFSRDDLAQVIYDNGLGELTHRSIDSHIAHIRKKCHALNASKRYIKTVQGLGYTFHAH